MRIELAPNHEDEPSFSLLILGLVNVIGDERRNRKGFLLRVKHPFVVEKIDPLSRDELRLLLFLIG